MQGSGRDSGVQVYDMLVQLAVSRECFKLRSTAKRICTNSDKEGERVLDPWKRSTQNERENPGSGHWRDWARRRGNGRYRD